MLYIDILFFMLLLKMRNYRTNHTHCKTTTNRNYTITIRMAVNLQLTKVIKPLKQIIDLRNYSFLQVFQLNQVL